MQFSIITQNDFGPFTLLKSQNGSDSTTSFPMPMRKPAAMQQNTQIIIKRWLIINQPITIQVITKPKSIHIAIKAELNSLRDYISIINLRSERHNFRTVKVKSVKNITCENIGEINVSGESAVLSELRIIGSRYYIAWEVTGRVC